MQVNPISNTNFKGSMAQTDKGAAYYKTNNGLKIGAIYGGLGVLSSFMPHTESSKLLALAGLGLHSCIGAFMDYKRNQNAEKAANYIQKYGVQRALATRDDIDISDNNRAYYKSNVGGKYGTIIGSLIGAITGFGMGASPKLAKALGASTVYKGKEKAALASFTLVATIVSTIMMGIGGLILGKINDYFTNRAASRNA